MKLSPISISLSPNVQRDDLYLSLKILLSPWKWKKGKFQIILEEYFKEYLKVKHTFFFNSGRSSLYVLLKALNPERVYIQGFTCNALVNPILWNKIKPVYVDCDEKDFNIDIKDLKEKIIFNGSGGVLIVQHTFGMPAEMEEILKIAKENNLIIVEDCAHSLGAEYLGRKIGTIGKASFFSFSRDKIISSVYGGFIATNDDILAEKINDIYKEIKNPSCFWIFQQLLHPILLNFLILPTYSFFGKYLLVFFQKTRILSKAVSKEEKKGEKPEYFPRKFPNALALLALNQIKKIDTFYNHRRKVAGVYYNKFKNSSYEIPKGMYPENLDFLGKKTCVS